MTQGMPSLRLIVLTNPVDGREDEYNDWYTGRHLDDVLAVHGFRAAQRFVFRPGKLSTDPGFRYLAIYEVAAATVEEAEAALLATAAKRELMPISGALARQRATWWFEAITDRVEAPAAGPESRKTCQDGEISRC
jgi:hypothetical protein